MFSIQVSAVAAAVALAAGSVVGPGQPATVAPGGAAGEIQTSTASSPAVGHCSWLSGNPPTKRRAPVRYGPGSQFKVAYYLDKGARAGIEGFCVNEQGNLWYCIQDCVLAEGDVHGKWIWSEHLVR